MRDKFSLRLTWCFGLAAGLLALFVPALAQADTYAETRAGAGFDGLTWPHWLMVPQYGNNSVAVISPASATFPISFFVQPDSAVDSVSPKTTNQSPQTITVHGETPGDGHQVAFGVGDLVGRGAELRLSVKPLKTVKVAIHAITQTHGSNHRFVPMAPTAAGAQSYLNQVYGPQTNTYFVVTRKDYDLDYDLGGGPNGAPNNFLEFRTQRPFTDEQNIIQDNATDPTAKFNVFFVHNFHSDADPRAVGVTVYLANVAYIQDTYRSVNRLNVLAHELGHLQGIRRHADVADNGHNEWYLPGTDPTGRLMCSGIVAKPDAKILIKSEWDTINKDQ